MLFDSAQFLLLFFPAVTLTYFLLPPRWRWQLLLAASCYFYMVLVPLYILVLLLIIGIDYTAARLIEVSEGRRRRGWLSASICANVSVLAVFKYFGFLNANVAALASAVGWNYAPAVLALALPVGLSFHTFQSMSYTIEVYRGRFVAERHFGLFCLYVMFYPQLVAGPIERPHQLLPQFRRLFFSGGAGNSPAARYDTDRMAAGLRLMLIGLVKKMVVADRLAIVVDTIYGDVRLYHGAPFVVATVMFAIQIYCDFSGYTDIARGSARAMGFELVENFQHPYGATSIANFWQRWHLSLSTWFRDYVYVPLGGNRVAWPRWAANIMTTFIISGLWHGANWTFVLWGAVHGLLIVAGRATERLRYALARLSGLSRAPRIHHGLRVAVTFTLVALAWILFRARTLADAGYVLAELPSGIVQIVRLLIVRTGEGFMVRLGLATLPLSKAEWLVSLLLAAVVLAFDQLAPADEACARPASRWWSTWPAYAALGLAVLFLGVFKTTSFIYYQF